MNIGDTVYILDKIGVKPCVRKSSGIVIGFNASSAERVYKVQYEGRTLDVHQSNLILKPSVVH